MIEPTFSEVIKVNNSTFCNLPLHVARVRETTRHFFGEPLELMISNQDIPKTVGMGLVKCRIIYARTVQSIEFTPYTRRKIGSMALVCSNDIDYRYKSTNRSIFSSLFAYSGSDEILIVKNGRITDSSFSNVVFEDATGFYTPSFCLLPGVKRAALLQEMRIKLRDIMVSDISSYSRLYLINAMIDLEDGVCFSVSALKPLEGI